MEKANGRGNRGKHCNSNNENTATTIQITTKCYSIKSQTHTHTLSTWRRERLRRKELIPSMFCRIKCDSSIEAQSALSVCVRVWSVSLFVFAHSNSLASNRRTYTWITRQKVYAAIAQTTIPIEVNHFKRASDLHKNKKNGTEHIALNCWSQVQVRLFKWVAFSFDPCWNACSWKCHTIRHDNAIHLLLVLHVAYQIDSTGRWPNFFNFFPFVLLLPLLFYVWIWTPSTW